MRLPRAVLPLLAIMVLSASCALAEGSLVVGEPVGSAASQLSQPSLQTEEMDQKAPSNETAGDQQTTIALNDAAVYDIFILENFGWLDDDQFGPMSLVVSSYCLGLVTQDSIGHLTNDERQQQVVLSISDETCDTVHRDSFAVRTAPADAETWGDALAIRHARTVWWGSFDEFADRAERRCREREDRLSLSQDIELSVSVVVELHAMLGHGDCDLLDTSAAENAASVADVAALESRPLAPSDDVVEPSTNLTVYFVRVAEANESGKRVSDLYALDVESGVVGQLTNSAEFGTGYAFAVSPDRTQILYGQQDSYETRQIIVANSDGSDPTPMGSAHYIGGLTWSSDGSTVLFDDQLEDGTRVISSIELATGERQIVGQPTKDDAWLVGVAGDDALYVDTDGRVHDLVRHDLLTGEVERLDVPYGSESISPDGSAFVMSISGSSADAGSMGLIDLTSDDAMVMTTIAGPLGEEGDPRLSPDRSRLVFSVGEKWNHHTLMVTDLRQPGTHIDLTPDLSEARVGNRFFWTPDSQKIIFSYGTDSLAQQLAIVGLDGTVTDLNVIGTPVAVIAG